MQGFGPSRKAFYKELKKVVELSDIVLQVLDARDPESCRNHELEEELTKGGKKLIQVINKIDLVPSGNAKAWARLLSKEFPTVTFKGTYQGPTSNEARERKAELKQIQTSSGQAKSEDPTEKLSDDLKKMLKKEVKQFITAEKPVIAVGVVGYPNVGKSSVVNALKHGRAAVVDH